MQPQCPRPLPPASRRRRAAPPTRCAHTGPRTIADTSPRPCGGEHATRLSYSRENKDMMGRLLIATLLAFIGQSRLDAELRYVVTAAPLGVGVPTNICVAVDSTDVHGVWWW